MGRAFRRDSQAHGRERREVDGMNASFTNPRMLCWIAAAAIACTASLLTPQASGLAPAPDRAFGANARASQLDARHEHAGDPQSAFDEAVRVACEPPEEDDAPLRVADAPRRARALRVGVQVCGQHPIAAPVRSKWRVAMGRPRGPPHRVS